METEFVMTDVRWVAFDLDDTLHEFSLASRAAMEMVYDYLHEEFGLYHDDMRSAYGAILKEGQSTHFVEDVPSVFYRRQRFEKLFDRFSILPHIHLDQCLNVYDDSLSQVLTLKEGALEILQACKKSGLNVMVVSEGPHDAQELTIKRLGLSEYVDRLFTSSKMGVHKTNGLLMRALDEVGCSPSECVMLGDNLDRDVIPALQAGMSAVWVKKDVLPSKLPAVPHVQSLKQIVARFDGLEIQKQFPVPKIAKVHVA